MCPRALNIMATCGSPAVAAVVSTSLAEPVTVFVEEKVKASLQAEGGEIIVGSVSD